LGTSRFNFIKRKRGADGEPGTAGGIWALFSVLVLNSSLLAKIIGRILLLNEKGDK
jgi:hypothetical protein